MSTQNAHFSSVFGPARAAVAFRKNDFGRLFSSVFEILFSDLKVTTNLSGRMEVSQFLRTQPSQYAMALTPLTEFQKRYHQEGSNHIQTFVERYQSRYNSKFPNVNHGFRNEEEQYLFCAGNFHGEVGYRSHLFLDMILCLNNAVLQRQPDLVEYFLKRGGSIWNDTFNLILQVDNIEMLTFVKGNLNKPDYYSIYPETKIESFETASVLIKAPKGSYLTPIYEDRPISEYPKLVDLLPEKIKNAYKKNVLNAYTYSIYVGQIKAGYSEEAKKSLKLPNENPEYLLKILALLDDVKLTKSLIRKISYPMVDTLTIFAIFSAVKSLKYLLKEIVVMDDEIRDSENEESILKLVDSDDFSLEPERINTTINLLIEYPGIVSFRQILVYLCFISANNYVLKMEDQTASIQRDSYRILEYGHKDFYKKVIRKYEINYSINVTTFSTTKVNELFFWILDNDVSLGLIDEFEGLSLTYPEVLRFLDHLKKDNGNNLALNRFILTPYLYFEFLPYLDDIDLKHPLFATFPPIVDKGQIVDILESDDVEYIEYLASNGPINNIPVEYIKREVNMELLSTPVKKLFSKLFPDYKFQDASDQIKIVKLPMYTKESEEDSD